MKNKIQHLTEQFKTNKIFENNSIFDNDFFGIKEFLKDDYLNNKFYVKKELLEECRDELEKVLFKYKYLLRSYEELVKNQKDEIKKLDDDFFKMNEVSFLGNSFFEMDSLKEHYNNIIEYEIIYRKNTILTNEYILKNNEGNEPIDFYIEEKDDSFFINFNELENIQEIFIEFYNDFIFSIFGVNKDDTLTSLFNNVNTNEKLFINTKKEKFKGLFVTGVGNISSFLKNIKIYKFSKKSIRKDGIVIYKPKENKKIEKILFHSNSETNIFLLDLNKLDNFINDINSSEELYLKKYLSENNLIKKNKEMKKNFKNFAIVELFQKNVNLSEYLKIFGKEKGD